MAARTTDPNKKKQFLDAAANLQNMLNQLGGPFRDMLMKQGGEKVFLSNFPPPELFIFKNDLTEGVLALGRGGFHEQAV